MVRMRFIAAIALLFIGPALSGQDDPTKKLPTGAILIKGAAPSASDSKTPVPEVGRVTKDAYQNPYFGLSYRLPEDWTTGYDGPPPTEDGQYVLAFLQPGPKFKRPDKGMILVTAQDLFFARNPATNAIDAITYAKEKLPSYYDVERTPTAVRIADRPFARFDYKSEVAGLHWYVLATEVRCHTVQFVLNSRDTDMLESLIKDMDRMEWKAPADAPLCVPGYASNAKNIVERVEPAITQHRSSAMPVRIMIDKRGRVKNVHVISAFEEQAKSITDALLQWRFKPYVRNGEAVEVETGLMFGASPD